MKRKFLITNDVGLALDKVNHLISCSELDDHSGDLTHLIDYNDILLDMQAHLQQAMEHLKDEEDQ